MEHDVTAREEAERIFYVFVAPELRDSPLGIVGRVVNETTEEYARRAEVLDKLFGAP